MEHFYALEDRDGVRWSWHLWPASTTEYKKLQVPLAWKDSMYSPLKQAASIPLVNYSPVDCAQCHALLNPYCQVDLASKMWACPFCSQRNRLPAYYDSITAEELPAELHPQSTTIEYAFPQGSDGLSPAFLFVVDLCVREDELEAVKQSLIQVLGNVPDTCYVGLLTYGSSVQVYELGFNYFPKIHFFEPKNHSSTYIQKQLGVGKPGADGTVIATPKNNFIMPFKVVERNLTDIIEDLRPDTFHNKPDQRSIRATGTALKVALTLLEYTFMKSGGRVLLLSGGPCTVGPGLVVNPELKEPIRSHHHLKNETAKHVHSATKFYTELAEQAVKDGHAVDILSASLDQVGVLEMWALCKATGGVITSCESFTQPQFSKSIAKLFEKDEKGWLKMGFNMKLEVKSSKELRVQGAIGHVSGTGNKHGNLSEEQLGIGDTIEWKAGVVDPNTTYAIYFDVANSEKNPLSEARKIGMVQFKTYYTHPSGQRMLRVTTLANNWAPMNVTPQQLLQGFDQECAAVILARLAVWKATTEDMDALKWIDRHLIRFSKRFATYRKGDPSSFTLTDAMSVYPQFMFHLRRGVLVSVFGSSPDETVFFRHYLLRESVANALMMIQPVLDEYCLDTPEPMPALLSSASLKQNAVLVLDTFFHIVVWSGSDVAGWRKANYHEQPEYSNIAALISAPKADAERTLNSRFPYPLHVVCDQGTSQARFLLAAVDPAPMAGPGSTGQAVNTEDASLTRFMEHLAKFSVDPEDS